MLLPYVGIAAVMVLSHNIEKWNMRGKGLLMIVSGSSYIIYLFHTTFEGFAKAAVHKIPIFADSSNELLFIFNVIVVVSCGIIVPVMLHRYVLRRYSITKVFFGMK